MRPPRSPLALRGAEYVIVPNPNWEPRDRGMPSRAVSSARTCDAIEIPDAEVCADALCLCDAPRAPAPRARLVSAVWGGALSLVQCWIARAPRISSHTPATHVLMRSRPHVCSQCNKTAMLKLMSLCVFFAAAEAFTAAAGFRPAPTLRASAPQAVIAPDVTSSILPIAQLIAADPEITPLGLASGVGFLFIPLSVVAIIVVNFGIMKK